MPYSSPPSTAPELVEARSKSAVKAPETITLEEFQRILPGMLEGMEGQVLWKNEAVMEVFK